MMLTYPELKEFEALIDRSINELEQYDDTKLRDIAYSLEDIDASKVQKALGSHFEYSLFLGNKIISLESCMRHTKGLNLIISDLKKAKKLMDQCI